MDNENGVPTIKLSEREWAYIMQQTVLVCIIIGRWLMPKGDLTRDQLSALLLNYVGTASDIVDLFSVLEVQARLTNAYVIAVLTIWSWSMFQFIFTITVTKDEEEEEETEERAGKKGHFQKPKTKTSAPEKGRKKSCIKFVHTVLETDAWAIFVCMMMQDGPYLFVRLVGLFYYRIVTYTMFFFITKNLLLLVLQCYRIVVLIKEYSEHKKQQPQAIKQLKDLKKRLTFQDKSDWAKIANQQSV